MAHADLRALEGDASVDVDALFEGAGADERWDAAAGEDGVAWSRVPRAKVGDDYRLVMLHAQARLHRFDGGALHLDGDLFEAIARSLAAGDAAWAERGARVWRALLMHSGEARSVWPHARTVLERYPAPFDENPGLLACFAAAASLSGEDDAAGLWDRVLAHPALGDSVARRLEVELDWVRSHLLLAGGDPARAVTVLARVRHGFRDLATDGALLAFTDASLELVAALAWLGRFDEALDVVDDSLLSLQADGELDVWIRAAAAHAAAATGDLVGARAARSAAEATSTDATTLVLRTAVPSELLEARAMRDGGALHHVVARAEQLERGRVLDTENVVTWRLVAVECAIACGERELARSLTEATRELLDGAPVELPAYRVRHAFVAAALGMGDDPAAADDRARAAMRAMGMAVPVLEDGQVAAGSRGTASAAMHFQLLGAFEARVGDDPVPDEAWSGRRQAKLLLALLLVHDGRLEVDHAVQLLWGDLDDQTARTRIKPMCASIRAVLAAGGASDPARELVARGGLLVLCLHPDDRSDLDYLRAAAARVERAPARSRDLALAALPSDGAGAIADLGSNAAADAVRARVDADVHQLVRALARAWEGRPAPIAVVDALRRAFESDPTSSDTCVALMRLHADRGDVASASSTFHALRQELRTQLGLDPAPFVTQVHSELLART